MTAPAFAVGWRREQTFDQACIRLWIFIRDESVDLFRRRRKSGQIKSDAPNQGPPICLRCRSQLLAFQSSQNESIKVRLCPGAVLNVRNGNLRRRSERPMIRIAKPFCSRGLIRVSSAEFHPSNQACDLLIAEPLILRHSQIFVSVTNRLDEETCVRLARNNGWAGIASLQNCMSGIQPQPGPLFLSAMTLQAMIDQNGANLGFELSKLIGGDRIHRRCRFVNQHENQQGKHHRLAFFAAFISIVRSYRFLSGVALVQFFYYRPEVSLQRGAVWDQRPTRAPAQNGYGCFVATGAMIFERWLRL